MWRLLLLVVGACSFRHGVLNGSDDPSDPAIDPPSGATADAPIDAPQCWSQPELGLDVCLASPLSGAITISSNTSIDTSSAGTGTTECNVLDGLCVIAAQSI